MWWFLDVIVASWRILLWTSKFDFSGSVFHWPSAMRITKPSQSTQGIRSRRRAWLFVPHARLGQQRRTAGDFLYNRRFTAQMSLSFAQRLCADFPRCKGVGCVTWARCSSSKGFKLSSQSVTSHAAWPSGIAISFKLTVRVWVVTYAYGNDVIIPALVITRIEIFGAHQWQSVFGATSR